MPATQQIHFVVKQKIHHSRPSRRNHVKCGPQDKSRIRKTSKKWKKKPKLLKNAKAQESEENVEEQATDVADVKYGVDGTEKDNMSAANAPEIKQSTEARIEDFKSAADRAIRDAKKVADDATVSKDGLAKVLRHLGLKRGDIEYLIAAYKDKKSVKRACCTVLGTQKIDAAQKVFRSQVSDKD